MRILLDIDGVMVPAKSWVSPQNMEDGFPMFSPKATRSLVAIISDRNIELILTTSHRHRFNIKEWKSIFKKRGISISIIKRTPPNNQHLRRKDEIVNWFKTNGQGSDFLIIDDDKSLNDLPVNLKRRLIQPSPYVGLNSSHTKEALEIIGNGI